MPFGVAKGRSKSDQEQFERTKLSLIFPMSVQLMLLRLVPEIQTGYYVFS
jgi:hypothetical protein